MLLRKAGWYWLNATMPPGGVGGIVMGGSGVINRPNDATQDDPPTNAPCAYGDMASTDVSQVSHCRSPGCASELLVLAPAAAGSMAAKRRTSRPSQQELVDIPARVAAAAECSRLERYGRE